MPPNGSADEGHGHDERDRQDDELCTRQYRGAENEHRQGVPATGRLGNGTHRDEDGE